MVWYDMLWNDMIWHDMILSLSLSTALSKSSVKDWRRAKGQAPPWYDIIIWYYLFILYVIYCYIASVKIVYIPKYTFLCITICMTFRAGFMHNNHRDSAPPAPWGSAPHGCHVIVRGGSAWATRRAGPNKGEVVKPNDQRPLRSP